MTRMDELAAQVEEIARDQVPLLGRASKQVAVESRVADVTAEAVLHGRFRFAPGLGWLEWTGGRWDDDPTAVERVHEEVRRYVDTQEQEAQALAVQLTEQAQQLLTAVVGRATPEQLVDDNDKLLDAEDVFAAVAADEEKAAMADMLAQQPLAASQAQLWLSMLSASRIASLVTLARRTQGVLTRIDELDAHPDLLNVGNGVVDLRTGALLPHSPELLLTHMAGGDYDPDAAHELWEQALAAVPTPLHDWFQLRVGQSITGHTPDDDAMVVAVGSGENGKSAIMSAIMRACGTYGRLISHRVLVAQAGQHPTELMDLRGLRFALMEETPEEGHLDTHQLKITIGTPQITARRMRQDDITFDTSHTLWINTNFLPQVDTTDHGTWRRLKAMEFPYRFLKPGVEPTEEHELPGDPTLKPRLATDPDVAAAVLSWMVTGAGKWYAEGRVTPADPSTVAAATVAWRSGSDVAYLFASELLVADRAAFITSADMLTTFNRYVEEQGKRPWSAVLMNRRMPASLEAAGLGAGYGVKALRVKVENQHSRAPAAESGDPFNNYGASPAKTYQPGDTVKAWAGLRFRTEVERRAGDLRVVR